MAEGLGCQPCDYITLHKTLSCESHSCPPVALKEASRHVVREPMWQRMQSYNHREFNDASNLSELGCRLSQLSLQIRRQPSQHRDNSLVRS